MTLTTRLSMFFLGMLTIVLLGFSVMLWALAREYLQQQIEERLTSALDTLDTAVDREPEGLDWDPNETHVAVGRENSPQAVRWEVRAEDGKCLDRSVNHGGIDLVLAWSENPPLGDLGTEFIEREGKSWQLAWRRVRGGSQAASVATASKAHRALWLLAGVPLEPMYATLRWLALALAGLSGGTWLVAIVAGRWACRRALAPVTRMATAVRGMGAADLGERLPVRAIRDEVGELQAGFNGLLDRLEEAFQRQWRFTGDASHQLRTPLTAILGQVDVILRRERSVEEYREVLTLVRSQADHLHRMVEALLFLARADSDADLAHLEPVNLATWLPEQLANVATHSRACDVQLVCKNLPPVRAQPMLLGQLLNNLLDNAFKYSEPGTPVRITVQSETDTATLIVQDAGRGIGAADLPHIFEPFFRSPESRRQGKAGVGLGLAMAQRIATALDGTLVAESEVGKGSRFTLRLSLAG